MAWVFKFGHHPFSTRMHSRNWIPHLRPAAAAWSLHRIKSPWSKPVFYQFACFPPPIFSHSASSVIFERRPRAVAAWSLQNVGRVTACGSQRRSLLSKWGWDTRAPGGMAMCQNKPVSSLLPLFFSPVKHCEMDRNWLFFVNKQQSEQLITAESQTGQSKSWQEWAALIVPDQSEALLGHFWSPFCFINFSPACRCHFNNSVIAAQWREALNTASNVSDSVPIAPSAAGLP